MKATAAHPYPKDFKEFLDWFECEEDCREYLEWVRWPDGFTCPSCGGRKVWRTDRGLWHCAACERQTSVTVGTVFEGTQKEGARGRGAAGKTLVLVVVEGDATKLGRVRFRYVNTIDAETAGPFVKDYIEPAAVVVTDGLGAYNALRAAGFDHQPHVLGKKARHRSTATRSRTSGHLALEMLADWNSSRCRDARAPASLPGRIRFSFQPPAFHPSRKAIPSPDPAVCDHTATCGKSFFLQETTTDWGYLNQSATHDVECSM